MLKIIEYKKNLEFIIDFHTMNIMTVLKIENPCITKADYLLNI